MRVAIVGSRRYANRSEVEDAVNRLGDNDIVISGGCAGVDTWAVIKAKARGLKTEVYLPKLKTRMTKWEATQAYYARNEEVVRRSEIVLAYVAGDRKGGTENTIKIAGALGVPVWIMDTSQ